jgi:type II secretory pathway component GspD/PulD (secretin)
MRPYPLALLCLAACNSAPQLDTRTFDVQYLPTDEAVTMIDPYVYVDRPGAPGRVTRTEQTVTVRETPDNLDRIAAVLARYDKPRPWVRLHFQIIAADGPRAADPRIAEVETELRKLFRYTGYRLMNETVLSGTARSSVSQQVGESPGSAIGVDIMDVRTTNDTGIVSMNVEFRTPEGTGLGSRINAREGQTVVLGNTQMRLGSGERGTIIVTVRPELVRG